jgi:hypothetical protein
VKFSVYYSSSQGTSSFEKEQAVIVLIAFSILNVGVMIGTAADIMKSYDSRKESRTQIVGMV